MMHIGEIRNPDIFQSLSQLLLVAEYPDTQIVDDSNGDGGIDAYVPSTQTLYAMYCPEKTPTPKEYYQKKIKKDLAKAVNLRDLQGYAIEHWVFITPAPISKELQSYLQKKTAEHNFSTGANMSEAHLVSLLTKHPRLRSQFPQLIVSDIEAQIEEVHASLSSQIGLKKPNYSLHKFKAVMGLALLLAVVAAYFGLLYMDEKYYAAFKSNMSLERAELNEVMTLRDRNQSLRKANLISEKEYYERLAGIQDKFLESGKRAAQHKSDQELYVFYNQLLLPTFPLFLLVIIMSGLLMRDGFKQWRNHEQRNQSVILSKNTDDIEEKPNSNETENK